MSSSSIYRLRTLMCGMGLFVAFAVACNGVATLTPMPAVLPTDRADEVTVAVNEAVPTSLVQATPTLTATSVVRATATESIAAAPVDVESIASPTLTSTATAADRVTTSVGVASTPIAASPEPTATAIPPSPRPTVTAVPSTATPLSVGTEVVPESTSVADRQDVTASPELVTPTAQPEPTVADATVQPTVTADYFEAYVEPCAPYPGSSKDPCERRVPWEWPVIKDPGFVAIIWVPWPPYTAREWVDWAFEYWDTVPHVIVRGVAVPGSTRCTSHKPSVLVKASATDSLIVWDAWTDIDCYTDIAVREYIFGSGPSLITYTSGGRSVDEDSDDFGTVARDDAYFANITSPLAESLEGFEWIFWLSAPLDASHAAWDPAMIWDVQVRVDGVVVAVSDSRNRSHDGSEHLDRLEPALEDFVIETKAAMAHYVDLYDGKVGESAEAPLLLNSSELSSVYEYIKLMGALDVPGFTFTPPPPSPLIPSSPTGLYGELRADPQPEVDLAWMAPVSSQVTTYKIKRVDSLGTEIVVAEIPSEFVEVTDRHMPIAGAEYTYTVIAVNEHGESAPSAPYVLRVP